PSSSAPRPPKPAKPPALPNASPQPPAPSSAPPSASPPLPPSTPTSSTPSPLPTLHVAKSENDEKSASKAKPHPKPPPPAAKPSKPAAPAAPAARGPSDAVRRTVSGSTEPEPVRGVETPELAAIREADEELFHPSASPNQAPWSADLPPSITLDPTRPVIRA